MQKIKALFILVYLLASNLSSAPTNVVFILADDLGYGDLSCLGQKKFTTPNIDRLAREGVKFINHYSGNTVCSPSRAVLMTGQHPGHVHCRGNVGTESLISLDPKMTTLPRLFKNAGYATGAFGKWGLGLTNEAGNQNPLTHGFDVFSGWKSQRIAHTYYPSTIVRNGVEEKLNQGEYIHDLIMEDAFSFIKKSVSDTKPFFCYIPTAVPHAAMHAPKALHEKWRKVFPEFDHKIGKYGAGEEPCPDVKNPIAGFAAMMENLDNQIGELLNILEELKVAKDTLVIFTSDNGTHIEGGHDPIFWNSNGPLRGHKRDMYDGGIRTPFLARWPAQIKAGTENEHISAFWDILPTMADITKQSIPNQVDGISMLETMRGNHAQQKQHKALYWEFRKGSDQVLAAKAVRKGDWKAVLTGLGPQKGKRKASSPKFELFNLKKDLGETNDVSGKYPEIVKEMEQIMKDSYIPLKK